MWGLCCDFIQQLLILVDVGPFLSLLGGGITWLFGTAYWPLKIVPTSRFAHVDLGLFLIMFQS